jgi:hypothetical protein
MRQNPLMTSEDVKAMIAAEREYDDAVKAFDAAIQKPDSKSEISEAFHTLLAKHKAFQAFGERGFPPL